MKSVVIFREHHGFTERVRAMRDAHPFVRVCAPEREGVRDALRFPIPDEWLPSDQTVPRVVRQRFKADALCIAAVTSLRIKAPFYWFIESDVVASQERWKKMFADTSQDLSDCLCAGVYSRGESRPGHWTHAGTPSWAQAFLITSCFRLSARAVDELVRCAVEMRETFGGVSVASVIRRAGMSFGNINRSEIHLNDQTFRGITPCLLNPSLINHPVKENSYGPVLS